MKRDKLWIVLAVSILMYCQPVPDPIDFRNDACHYCSMGIADPTFAAELVTQKGKVYKFDSIECMIRSYKNMEEPVAHILVMDFAEPGKFISVHEAHFLRSDELKSPMGANIAAFSGEDELIKQGMGGAIFDWNTMVNHIH